MREDVIVPAPLCLRIVAAWSNTSSVTYSFLQGDTIADAVICHKIQLQSPIMSNEVSSLYYAMMKDVSNSGAIYKFPLTFDRVLTLHTWQTLLQIPKDHS